MVSNMEPRVYVACLHCYNSGKLHGEWFEADDGLGDEVDAFFNPESSERLPCGGEELMVHDSEGFDGMELGEVGVSEAEETGAALREHGVALALWIGQGRSLKQAIKDLNNGVFQGDYESAEDYVEEHNEDFVKDVPDFIKWHIDWKGVADDLETNGAFTSIEHAGRVYIFEEG